MRLRDSLLSAAEPDPPQPYSGPHSPLVEIVIPVRNEDRDLAPCIRGLRTYLREGLPFAARITIADNGSTDGTWALALALAGELPLVHAVRLERPGRGGALCSIWSASDADVYAYMDVDLSTDLNALLPLLPLLAPLLSGHSDVAVVMLTPAADRPYVGGSADNSILQLTFGYNGLGRLTGKEAGSVGFRNGAGPSLGLGNGAGPSFGGQAGLARLFGSEMGGQISWLFPAALIALAALLWMSRRAPRTGRTRSAALLWGGWLVLTGLVFSYMSGIIHPYYTVALAPAVGALTGIGAFARVVLAAMLVAAAGWAWVLLGRNPGWYPWLRAAIALAAIGSAGAILAWPRQAGERAWAPGTPAYGAMAVVPIVLAMIAGLGGPLAYSINTAATAHTGALPSAGPMVAGAFGAPGGPADAGGVGRPGALGGLGGVGGLGGSAAPAGPAGAPKGCPARPAGRSPQVARSLQVARNPLAERSSQVAGPAGWGAPAGAPSPVPAGWVEIPRSAARSPTC
jgi:hypothetical protein